MSDEPQSAVEKIMREILGMVAIGGLVVGTVVGLPPLVRGISAFFGGVTKAAVEGWQEGRR